MSVTSLWSMPKGWLCRMGSVFILVRNCQLCLRLPDLGSAQRFPSSQAVLLTAGAGGVPASGREAFAERIDF